MDNIPRLIFYLSGVFIVSAGAILFTSEFISQAGASGLRGILFLLGYSLIYLNVVLASSRRFMRRLSGKSALPYVFGAIAALPPIVWINIYETNLGRAKPVFALCILLACGLGAYLGHRAGLKAQIRFQKALEEYLSQNQTPPQMPESD